MGDGGGPERCSGARDCRHRFAPGRNTFCRRRRRSQRPAQSARPAEWRLQGRDPKTRSAFHKVASTARLPLLERIRERPAKVCAPAQGWFTSACGAPAETAVSARWVGTKNSDREKEHGQSGPFLLRLACCLAARRLPALSAGGSRKCRVFAALYLSTLAPRGT